ncbi:MAG: hypothetical protein IKO14_03090 [Oscillibacter sp.]|nr:hypothetical protein [Oscillibacter sp.]
MFKKVFAKIADSMKRKNVEIRLECDSDSQWTPKDMVEFIRNAKEVYPSAKVTAIMKY